MASTSSSRTVRSASWVAAPVSRRRRARSLCIVSIVIYVALIGTMLVEAERMPSAVGGVRRHPARGALLRLPAAIRGVPGVDSPSGASRHSPIGSECRHDPSPRSVAILAGAARSGQVQRRHLRRRDGRVTIDRDQPTVRGRAIVDLRRRDGGQRSRVLARHGPGSRRPRSICQRVSSRSSLGYNAAIGEDDTVDTRRWLYLALPAVAAS